MACFIIAEAGVNHNGSVDCALEMVSVAAKAGADAIKFQTFNALLLAKPGAKKAEYQARETGEEEDQLEMLRKLELPKEAYPLLISRCKEQGIEFLSTPFDEESADMLVALGMRRIKVPSGEITNLPFLEYLASFNLPIILSTGMSDIGEIEDAVNIILSAWDHNKNQARDLTLLHCTSNYPALPKDVNLNAIPTIIKKFALPVGYSDHTLGTSIAIGAVAMGACVIEKHFTLDRQLPGPDHQASLEPDELSQLVKQIKAIEVALGDGVKQPSDSELPVRLVARRSITLKRAMKAGATINLSDLAVMRPGSGIAPKYLNALQGRHLARDLDQWHTIQWDDLLP